MGKGLRGHVQILPPVPDRERHIADGGKGSAVGPWMTFVRDPYQFGRRSGLKRRGEEKDMAPAALALVETEKRGRMMSTKKKTSLDDLIVHFNQPKSMEMLWVCTFYIIHMLTLHILRLQPSIFVTVSALSAFMAAILSVIREVARDNKRKRAWRILERLQEEVPYHLSRNAMNIYDYPWSAIAAIECHESHMPGDCPLCGAE